MTEGSSASGGVPPGFRFHPTDEELLHFYLKKKVAYHKFDMEVIREVDLNKIEPWELQEKCKIGCTPQNEWYFFSHKDRKYPTGSRTNRATSAGFWKATGRDKCIRDSFKKIGMRKTLVFYRGRAPHGQKTDWIMHEYRIEEPDQESQTTQEEDGWVVCRVFKKKHLFKVNSEGRGKIMKMSGADELSMMSSPSLFSLRNNDLTHYLSDHPNYSHISIPVNHQYTQMEAQNFLPTHDRMISNPGNYNYDHNFSGLPNAAPPTDDQNLNHWDGLMLTGSHHQDENAGSPITQINQLPLRGEMDFWGYGK